MRLAYLAAIALAASVGCVDNLSSPTTVDFILEPSMVQDLVDFEITVHLDTSTSFAEVYRSGAITPRQDPVSNEWHVTWDVALAGDTPYAFILEGHDPTSDEVDASLEIDQTTAVAGKPSYILGEFHSSGYVGPAITPIHIVASGMPSIASVEIVVESQDPPWVWDWGNMGVAADVHGNVDVQTGSNFVPGMKLIITATAFDGVGDELGTSGDVNVDITDPPTPIEMTIPAK